MARILFCALIALVVAAGCGKKKRPPDASVETPVQKPAEVKKATAPGGVPQAFVDLVEAKWPEIKKEGDAFLAKFAEFSKARGENDREKMATAGAAAKEHFNTASEEWAKIAYWPDDNDVDDATREKCEKYIRNKSAEVKGWMKKSKGIKELSTVK
jgi:hypothetical protein